ncbi:SPFH domain-containing protein [Streptomyces sp. NPDC088341]|uniref:slipin family protein n=1 Tax=Streptomyces sp. NPDC088341 TaxID=3154870 RepID=UPI00341D2ED2
MVQELVVAVIAAICALGLYGMSAARVVKQYERGVVLRLGQLREGVRGPGFTMIVPFVDRLHKVNMQIVTMPVPAQDGITRDNVTVRVDAVIYFKVVDAADAVIRVEDYRFAVSQMAQTSLRSIIGKSDLDDLLSNRERLNQGLELMIDSPAIGWGVQIDRVEIKDVSLPETMKRSMARQAEADRERRARVINADAELQASKKLAEAAKQMSEQPAALQLRLLQTVVAVAAEKNSTLVLPFPVELLRFLERATPAETAQAMRAVSGVPVPAAVPSASGGARTEPRTSSEAAERSEMSEAREASGVPEASGAREASEAREASGVPEASGASEAPAPATPVGEAPAGEAAIGEAAIDEAPPPRAAPRQKPVPTQPRV